MVQRHQCMVYDGAPTQHLKLVAGAFAEKLQSNNRCLYLNSPPMVAGMRSYLAAAGVDVEKEVRQGRAIITSDQSHLLDGRFHVERMMNRLKETLELPWKKDMRALGHWRHDLGIGPAKRLL